MTRRGAGALGALAAIVLVTAAWWALALWPTVPDTPAWVDRARAVCFGVTDNRLPNAGGWIVLIGEPLGMLGFLLIVWGGVVREALGALWQSRSGTVLLSISSLLLIFGIGAAGARVASAFESGEVFTTNEGAVALPERLNRAVPPLALVDQRGDTVRLEAFRGQPVFVAFAYGHCETVCPLVVHDAVEALARKPGARLLIVTLDPWRDTPLRLPSIARAWRLPSTAHLLSGSVPDVQRTLDDWGVARSRNERTGEILHPVSVYLIDRDGRLAYIAPGDPGRLAALLVRL